MADLQPLALDPYDTVDLTVTPIGNDDLIAYDGVTQSLRDWAAARGTTTGHLRARLRLGWSLRFALTEPVMVNDWKVGIDGKLTVSGLKSQAEAEQAAAKLASALEFL